MSVAERKAISELVIWGVALFFVWMRLTDGSSILGQTLGLAVVEQSPLAGSGSLHLPQELATAPPPTTPRQSAQLCKERGVVERKREGRQGGALAGTMLRGKKRLA